jgi:hypothetical protein
MQNFRSLDVSGHRARGALASGNFGLGKKTRVLALQMRKTRPRPPWSKLGAFKHRLDYNREYRVQKRATSGARQRKTRGFLPIIHGPWR